MAAVNRAIEAGVDLAMPILGLRLYEALAQRKAGIVDQNVEAAEVFDDLLDHRLDRDKFGDVRLICFGLAAFCRDLADELVRIFRGRAVVDGNACALGGEAERDFAADSAGRARHQRDFAFQPQIHVCSFTL